MLCITHLAQVASLADHHLFIQKLSEDRTRASVAVLSEEQRVEEIARMLGGYKVSRATRESARELLASKY